MRTKGKWYSKNSIIFSKGCEFSIASMNIIIGGSDGISRKEAKANAQFICTAVNNHDALVEALECMTAAVNRVMETGGITNEDIKKSYEAQAALDAVKEV